MTRCLRRSLAAVLIVLSACAVMTIGATSPLAAISRWVAVTHSASREIGTQTSLTMPSVPVRNAHAAQ